MPLIQKKHAVRKRLKQVDRTIDPAKITIRHGCTVYYGSEKIGKIRQSGKWWTNRRGYKGSTPTSAAFDLVTDPKSQDAIYLVNGIIEPAEYEIVTYKKRVDIIGNIAKYKAMKGEVK